MSLWSGPISGVTKATVQSSTVTLRHKQERTGVTVVELIPPHVATELGRVSKAGAEPDPEPMPLVEFIVETVSALEGDTDKVSIGDAKRLMATVDGGTAGVVFSGMNR